MYDQPSPTVELTETDIDTLIAEFERLHLRIDNTRQDVRQLNVDRLRERVAANEAVLEELTERFVNVRARKQPREACEGHRGSAWPGGGPGRVASTHPPPEEPGPSPGSLDPRVSASAGVEFADVEIVEHQPRHAFVLFM